MPRYWAIVACIALLKVFGVLTAIGTVIFFVIILVTPTPTAYGYSFAGSQFLAALLQLMGGLFTAISFFALAQYLALQIHIEKNTRGMYALLYRQVEGRSSRGGYTDYDLAPSAPPAPKRKQPPSMWDE